MDSQALAKELADYDAKRKGSNDVLTEAMKSYGIPEIRSRVSGLRTTLSNTENALNAVDPSVTGRTQGSLVTEAQRQRQVVNERAPIAQQYGQQSQALATESANQGDALQAAKLLAENQINDYTTGRQSLSDRYTMAVSAEAERRRREEADRAFELQKQQVEDSRRAAAASAGYGIGGGSSSSGGISSPSSTDAIQQDAYNDVRTRASSLSDSELKSDYQATARSAGFGNTRDKYKMEFYAALRPDLFGTASINVLGNGGQLRY